MLKIVYRPEGVIIGEKVISEIGILALKDPRIMQISQTEEGQINVNIVPMLGQPKWLEIDRGVMNYDVNDEKLINAYKKSVSGISLVREPTLVDGD